MATDAPSDGSADRPEAQQAATDAGGADTASAEAKTRHVQREAQVQGESTQNHYETRVADTKEFGPKADQAAATYAEEVTRRHDWAGAGELGPASVQPLSYLIRDQPVEGFSVVVVSPTGEVTRWQPETTGDSGQDATTKPVERHEDGPDNPPAADPPMRLIVHFENGVVIDSHRPGEPLPKVEALTKEPSDYACLYM